MAQITIANVPTNQQFTVDTTPLSDFVFTFEWYDETDIEVYDDDTLQTITTHYTVSTAGGTVYDDGNVGGTISLVTPVTSTTITIRLAYNITKPTNFSPGQLDIRLLNTVLSKMVTAIRVERELLERTFQVAPYEAAVGFPTVAERAEKYLYFDVDGNITPTTNVVADVGEITITSFMETMLTTASTAALARTQLSLGSLATKSQVVMGDIQTAAVSTAALADNAVTLAKLAGGTAGKYLGFDASGDPAELGAIWEYRGSATATAAALLSLSSTLLGNTGLDYKLVIEYMTATTIAANAYFRVRISEDNLSTILATNYSSATWKGVGSPGTLTMDGQQTTDTSTSWYLTNANASYYAGNSTYVVGELNLTNFGGTTGRVLLSGFLSYLDTSSNQHGNVVMGSRVVAPGAAGYNSLQFTLSSGANFDAKVYVYSRKKSALTA